MDLQNQEAARKHNAKIKNLEKVIKDSVCLIKDLNDAQSQSDLKKNYVMMTQGMELVKNIEISIRDFDFGCDQNDSLCYTKMCLNELVAKSKRHFDQCKKEEFYCDTHHTDEFILTECPKTHKICRNCQYDFSIKCTHLDAFMKTNTIPRNFSLPVCWMCFKDKLLSPLSYNTCVSIFITNIVHYSRLIEKIRCNDKYDGCLLCGEEKNSLPLHTSDSKVLREKLEKCSSHSVCSSCFDKYTRSLQNGNYLTLESNNGKANGWDQVSVDPFKGFKCIFPFCNRNIEPVTIGQQLSKIMGNRSEILDYLKKMDFKSHHALEAFSKTYLSLVN